jgi:hypothetical protein
MIVRRPSGFIAPCQPSKASRPPSGQLWVHEIKHDGLPIDGAPGRLAIEAGRRKSRRSRLVSNG